MAVDPKLLEILVCPVDKTPLEVVDLPEPEPEPDPFPIPTHRSSCFGVRGATLRIVWMFRVLHLAAPAGHTMRRVAPVPSKRQGAPD